MLLQIHDELIFECLEKDQEYVKKTIKEAMISISKSEHHMFSIPLEVNINSGYNWEKHINFPNTCPICDNLVFLYRIYF